ncbi:MAG TPA: TIGR03960 family B12-binding radical SAM protein [Fervidobacterium sp.]|nr:TIGR03960 family B12-binding radical SAM protein [Fervidobacterium sp.]
MVNSRNDILKFLSEHLNTVSKPGRYIGGEYNSVLKDGKDLLRVALAFPDVYEVGMSHYGLDILYWLANELDYAYAERTFLPWPDMVQLMEDKGVPLFTLETKTPIYEMDVLGISIEYELSYTNVLKLLELSKIPISCYDRDDDVPIVIGGGPVMYSCEPIAEAFDVIYLGDGEVNFGNMLKIIKETKGMRREERLKELLKLDGMYVPMFYQQQGKKIVPKYDFAPALVRRNILTDLNSVKPPSRKIIPHVESIHDRAVIEISRGCTRGCRFCSAGYIYRPVRERNADEIVSAVNEMISNTGYEELSLLSLSSLDHSQIAEIVEKLLPYARDHMLSISIPSTRVDAFNIKVANSIAEVRKTGLTFAPEAGSQKMRDAINKQITHEDIISTAKKAKSAGWQRLKLYFMVGFPDETEEDIRQIGELIKEVKKVGFFDLTASVNMLIPKPHSAFQFAQLQPPEYMQTVRKILGPYRNFAKIDISDGKKSFIEGILSRGDRKLFSVIEKAYKMGYYDEWGEYFSYEKWENLFSEVDLSSYIGPYEFDDDFPWSHLDSGVDKTFLWQEFQNFKSGIATQDCRNGCTLCGVCMSYGVANVIID